MHPLSAHEMVEIWEQGQAQHPLDRALTVLAAVWPEMTREQLAALSIARRDACLLELRERTFGTRLDGFSECPRCRERIEFTLTTCDIPRLSEDKGEYELETADFNLRFRLPNSKDLAALVGGRDVRQSLLQDCLLEARRGGQAVSYRELPAEAVDRLAECVAECGQRTEVLFALECPSCSHRWQILFDIASFFWAEIAAQAKRLLREVHALAKTYGWSEAEILALSPIRRQCYLEMVD